MKKAKNAIFVKIQQMLFQKKEIPILLIGVCGILVLSLFFGIKAIQAEVNCGKARDAYSKSVEEFSDISSEAESTWKSLPIYDREIFGEARVSDRQIYSTFEDYFNSNYKTSSNRELRIGMRLINNDPQCFDAREVAEAQDYLDNF